jgi:hypothetical protein
MIKYILNPFSGVLEPISVESGSDISHSALLNLSSDDHDQYLYLDGRSGGQTAVGGTDAGDNLILYGNSTDGGYVHLKSEVLVGFGEGTDGTAMIISANIKDTTPPPELFLNNDLETWSLIEIPDDWSIAADSQNFSTYPSKTADSHAGTYAFSTNGTGDLANFSGYSQSYRDLIPGDSYTMKFWGKGSSKTATIAYFTGDAEWWAFTGPNAGTWVDLNPNFLTDGGLEVWVGDETPQYWGNATDDPAYLVTKSVDSDTGTYAVQMNGDGMGVSGVYSFAEGLTPGDSYTFTARLKNVGDAYLLYIAEDEDTGAEYYWNFSLLQWDEVNPSDVVDGGMEIWSDPSTLTNWGTFAAGGGSPTLSQEAVIIHSGTYAAKLTPDAGTALVLTQTMAGIGSAGDEVGFKGYFATASTGSVTLVFLNAAGNEIWNFTTDSWDAFAGPPPTSDQESTYSGIGTSYERKEAWLTIPADGGITVRIKGDTAVDTYIDDVYVRVDDFVPTADYYHTFTTTANYATYTSPSPQVTVHPTGMLIAAIVSQATVLVDTVTLKKDGTGSNIFYNYSFEQWYTQSNTDPNILGNWNEQYYGIDTHYLEQTTVLDEDDYVNGGYSSVLLQMWGLSGDYFIYQDADCSSLAVGTEMTFKFSAKARGSESSVSIYFLNGGGDEVWNFNTETWDAYLGGEPAGDNIEVVEPIPTTGFLTDGRRVKVPTDQHIVTYIGRTASIAYQGYLYLDDLFLTEYESIGPTSDYLYTFNLTGSWAEYTSPSPQVEVPSSGNFAAAIGSVDVGAIVDDYRLLKDGTAPDIAINGTYESWTPVGYYPTNWIVGYYYNYGGTVTREGTIVRPGSTYSAKIANDGDNRRYLSQAVDGLTPGNDYVLQMYVRTDATDSDMEVMILNDVEDDATQIWDFIAEEWDTFTGSLASQTSEYRYDIGTNVTWTLLDYEFTAPANGTVMPLFYAEDVDGVIYLDDSSFKIKATGGTPTTITVIKDENDYNDLDENDVVLRVQSDDGVNFKNWFEITGDGMFHNGDNLFEFGGDIIGDTLAANNMSSYGIVVNNANGELTSASIVGQAGNLVAVNGTADGLQFISSAGLGDVIGPGSATDGNIATFDGVTGKIIKDSGVTISSGDINFNGVDVDFLNVRTTEGVGFDTIIHGGDAYTGLALPRVGGNLILTPGEGVNGGPDGDVRVDNLSTDGVVVATNSNGTLETTTEISELWIVAAHELATFTNNSGSHEFGETEDSFTLSWTYNRNGDNPTSQEIDNGIGSLPVADRSYNYSGPGITTTTTYTIDAVGDDTNPSSLSTTVNFYWKRYWGVSTGDVFSGGDVMSVLNPQGNEYGTSRADSESFTSGGTPTYYYFAYPAAWGAVTGWTFNGFTQDVDDLEYSNGVDAFGASPTNVSLTNASGGTTNYYIVRSVYQYQNTTDVMAIS